MLIVVHQTISTQSAEQRTEWADEDEEKNNTEEKKVLISLSLFSLSVSLPFCLPLIQCADCFRTENGLPRYSAWPIYHIDQLMKKSDVHRRLARNVRVRDIMIFCTLWQRRGALAAQRLSLADMVIFLTWPCDVLAS